jgi:hypothetical protein
MTDPREPHDHPHVNPVVRAVTAIDAVIPASRVPANKVIEDSWRLMPWLGVLFGLAAVLTLPWVLYLGVRLPERQTAAHYDVAWAGFDVGLFLGLAATSYAALRRTPWLGIVAGATGALLVTDAWFDVVTSPDTDDRLVALAMALVVELPLAATCLWMCLHAQRLAEKRISLLLGRRRP